MDQHTQMSFYRKATFGLRAERSNPEQENSNGLIWQADGKPIGTTLTEGLISVKGDYIFPIIRGIILLLKTWPGGFEGECAQGHHQRDKQLVKKFL